MNFQPELVSRWCADRRLISSLFLLWCVAAVFTCISQAETVKYTITATTVNGGVSLASTKTFFGYGAGQRIPAGLNISAVITLDTSKGIPYSRSGQSEVAAAKGNSPVTDTTIYLENGGGHEPYDLGADTSWGSLVDLYASPGNQSLAVYGFGADFNWVRVAIGSRYANGGWPTDADWTKPFIYTPTGIPTNSMGSFSVYTTGLGVSGTFTVTGIAVSGPYTCLPSDSRPTLGTSEFHYKLQTYICAPSLSQSCTPAQVFALLRVHPTPVDEVHPVDTCDVTYIPPQLGKFPVGHVIFYVDPSTLSVTNVTLPDHVFYLGQVVRSVVVSPEADSISILTVGTGDPLGNWWDTPYMWKLMGQTIWPPVDQEIIDWFRTH